MTRQRSDSVKYIEFENRSQVHRRHTQHEVLLTYYNNVYRLTVLLFVSDLWRLIRVMQRVPDIAIDKWTFVITFRRSHTG